jgi:hypothetical protein
MPGPYRQPETRNNLFYKQIRSLRLDASDLTCLLQVLSPARLSKLHLEVIWKRPAFAERLRRCQYAKRLLALFWRFHVDTPLAVQSKAPSAIMAVLG